MINKKLRRAIAITVGVLLLIYVGYQIQLSNKTGIETEKAMYATVSDTINTKGFAVRNEQVITASYNGVLNYVIADGSRVSAGNAIADVYQNESDATAQSRITRLDSEMAVIESLTNPGDTYIANPELIGSQINTSLEDIVDTVKQGNFTLLSEKRVAFQTAVSRKNIITGSESADDYRQRLSELENERANILSASSSKISSIYSDSAGYFISTLDGLENKASYEDAVNFTVDDINTLLGQNTSIQLHQNGQIGKISTEFSWYMVCVVNEDEMLKLRDISSVKLEVPFATTTVIPAEIAAANTDYATGNTALILKCTYMGSDIARIRKENIRIIVNTYEGVLVNEKSIFFNDIEKETTHEDGTTETVMHKNIKGVYIKDGSKMKFVQIFTDKTINGYAICKTELGEEDSKNLVTSSTIHLYDEVIVGGTDLYDGKLIN